VNTDDWNARYAAAESVWGVAANRFVAAELAELAPGRALDLACGEGRNAVWLAERGWQVTGIDYAEVAVERARRLAEQRGVNVELVVGDVLTAPIEDRAYELVLISYLQLTPDERHAILVRAAAALAPGGTFLLVGHELRNHADGHGGPSDPERLWVTADVAATVEEQGLEVEHASEVLRDVVDAPRPAIDSLVRARRPRGT
jgi:SAM-dependent methyltransferase